MRRRTELRIGIFVLFSFSAVVGLLLFIGQLNFFSRQDYFVIEFDYIEKLEIGSHVLLNGNLKVGKVSNISFLEEKQKILVNIYFTDRNIERLLSKYHIDFKENSVNMFAKSNVEMFIKNPLPIDRDSVKKRYFIALKSVSFIDKLTVLINKFDKVLEKDIQPILKNIQTLTNTMNVYMANFNPNDMYIKESMHNIYKITRSLKDSSFQIQSFIEGMQAKKVNTILEEAEGFSKALSSLIYKIDYEFKKAKPEVLLILKTIRELVSDINRQENMIGNLIKNPEVKENIDIILKNFNKILEIILKNPLVNFSETIRKETKNPF